MCLLLLLSMGCTLESPEIGLTESEKPKSELIVPEEVDLGDVHLLSTTPTIVSSEIVIRNAGTVNVQIERIQKQCNCTTARVSLPQILEPGGSITILFDFTLPTKTSAGFSSRTTIHTDEGGGKEYPILFTGRVLSQPTIALVPAVVDFGVFGDWESPESIVQILAPDSSKIGDIKVSQDNEGVVCSVMEEEANRPVKLRVTAADQLDCGTFVRHILFQTENGEATFVVRGIKTDGLISSHPVVVFRRNELIKSLLLRQHPKITASTIRVSSNVRTIELMQATRLEAGLSRIDIRLVDAIDGDFLRGELEIVSQSEMQESKLTLPVFINLRKEND